MNISPWQSLVSSIPTYTVLTKRWIAVRCHPSSFVRLLRTTTWSGKSKKKKNERKRKESHTPMTRGGATRIEGRLFFPERPAMTPVEVLRL